MRGYRYYYSVRREGTIPAEVIATAFANAAAWLESNPQYDAHTAIRKATDHLPEHVARYAVIGFREAFGVWGSDDESVLMLCFAACAARSGEL